MSFNFPLNYISAGDSLKRYLAFSITIHVFFYLFFFIIPDSLPSKKVTNTIVTFNLIDIKIPPKPATKVIKPVTKKTSIKKKFAVKAKPTEKDIIIKKKTKKKEEAKEIPKVEKELAQVPAEKVTIAASELQTRFHYYMNLIRSKIQRHWKPPAQFAGREVTISFRIFRNGQIGLVNKKDSSGNKTLDRLALRAINLCNPFAPLPVTFRKNFEDVTVTLKVEE